MNLLKIFEIFFISESFQLNRLATKDTLLPAKFWPAALGLGLAPPALGLGPPLVLDRPLGLGPPLGLGTPLFLGLAAPPRLTAYACEKI